MASALGRVYFLKKMKINKNKYA